MEQTNEIKLKRLKVINKTLTIVQIIVLILIVTINIMNMVFSINKNCGDNGGAVVLTDEEIKKATFNNRFTPYMGNNKSLTQVKALINIVLANNIDNEEIYVKINNRKIDVKDITSKLASLTEDNYKITYDMNIDGYITNVNIAASEGKYILVEE